MIILLIAVLGIVFIVFILLTRKEGKQETIGRKLPWTTSDLKEATTQPFKVVSVVTDKVEPTLPSTLGVASPESEVSGSKYTQLVDPRTELTPLGERVKQLVDQAMLDYAAGRITKEEYDRKVTYYGFPPYG